MEMFPDIADAGIGRALIGFLLGWVGASLAVRRWLRSGSLSEAVSGGFILWQALIVQVAVIMATTGLYNRWVFIVLPLVIALGGFACIGDWRALRDQIRGALSGVLGPGWGPLGVAICIGFVVLCSLWTLAYVSDTWDTLQYHRPISLLFLQTGKLSGLPATYYAIEMYPKNGQLVAAWMIGISNWDSPSRVLPTMNVATMALAIYALLRSWGASAGESCLLSAIAFNAPVFLCAVLREAGYIDVNVASVCLAGLAFVSRMRTAGPDTVRFGSVALLCAAFILGLKGNGFLYTFLIAGLGLLALIASRSPVRRIASMVALGCVLTLCLSSYWMIANWQRQGNPLAPVRVSVGETEVFPGYFSAHEITAVQTPEVLEGKPKWQQFAISVSSLEVADYLWHGRKGGFGYHFLYFGLPFWVLGVVVALARGRWWQAATLIACATLFALHPNNWWARYVLFFIALAPVAAFEAAGALNRWPGIRSLVLGAYCFVGIGMLGVSIYSCAYSEFRDRTVAYANGELRTYIIPSDSFRVHWPPDLERELYRWLGDRIPVGARLGYQVLEGDNFMALMVRPDYRSEVEEIRIADRSRWADFDILSMNANFTERVELEQLGWSKVFENERYVVFTRPGFKMDLSPREQRELNKLRKVEARRAQSTFLPGTPGGSTGQ